MTNEARALLRKLLEEYQPHHIKGEFDELLDPGVGLGRYLLVEANTSDGTYWLTLHPTPADAAEYYSGQEYPEDWSAVTLIDLENGQEFEEHLVFAPKGETHVHRSEGR